MDYARNPSPIRSAIPSRLAPSSRPLKTYNRSHMQPALRSPIPDASLAVLPVNGENSHQGFAGRNPAPNPVREACKFTVLLGMRGQAELNRAGSRCTSKERDTESGNDYFGARYYASSMGRFMSPDDDSDQNAPDPQSWNLYSYVRNNPLTNTDSDGHDVNVCDNQGNCRQISNAQYQAAQQAGNGSLNVPTLDQVGMNGNGSGQFNSTAITDSSGQTVGSATYVSDGPTDYYANRNGINQIGQASATVGPIAGVVMGAVGIAMPAMFAADAAPLATGIAAAAKKAVDLANLSNKIERQMVTRGWTKQDIQETIDQGVPHDAVNKGTGGPATEYVNPSNGRFVVVDNATKQLIQVSGPGHLPNYMMK